MVVGNLKKSILRFFYEFAIHKLLETPLHYAYCNCNIGYKTNNPIWNTDLSSGCNEQIDSNNSSHLFEKYDGISHLIAFWVLFAYQIFPDSNLDSSECNSFKGLFITQRLLRYVFDSLLNERLALWTFFLLVHIKFMNVRMNSSAIKEFQFRYKNVKLMQWMTP